MVVAVLPIPVLPTAGVLIMSAVVVGVIAVVDCPLDVLVVVAEQAATNDDPMLDVCVKEFDAFAVTFTTFTTFNVFFAA